MKDSMSEKVIKKRRTDKKKYFEIPLLSFLTFAMTNGIALHAFCPNQFYLKWFK